MQRAPRGQATTAPPREMACRRQKGERTCLARKPTRPCEDAAHPDGRPCSIRSETGRKSTQTSQKQAECGTMHAEPSSLHAGLPCARKRDRPTLTPPVHMQTASCTGTNALPSDLRLRILTARRTAIVHPKQSCNNIEFQSVHKKRFINRTPQQNRAATAAGKDWYVARTQYT